MHSLVSQKLGTRVPSSRKDIVLESDGLELMFDDRHLESGAYLDWELENHIDAYGVDPSMYQDFFISSTEYLKLQNCEYACSTVRRDCIGCNKNKVNDQ